MAKQDEQVMSMVEAELSDNPDITTSELYERAKQRFSNVAKMTLRQFNARFPLQIKRRKSMAAGGRRRRARKAAGARKQKGEARSRTAREQVRHTLLGFAADLSAADDRKDLVRVLANIDGYVDDVMKAAGSA